MLNQKEMNRRRMKYKRALHKILDCRNFSDSKHIAAEALKGDGRIIWSYAGKKPPQDEATQP